MSRLNKVNPDHYKIAGRLTPDDLAREWRKQDDANVGGHRRRPRRPMPPWMADEQRDDFDNDRGEQPDAGGAGQTDAGRMQAAEARADARTGPPQGEPTQGPKRKAKAKHARKAAAPKRARARKTPKPREAPRARGAATRSAAAGRARAASVRGTRKAASKAGRRAAKKSKKR